MKQAFASSSLEKRSLGEMATSELGVDRALVSDTKQRKQVIRKSTADHKSVTMQFRERDASTKKRARTDLSSLSSTSNLRIDLADAVNLLLGSSDDGFDRESEFLQQVLQRR